MMKFKMSKDKTLEKLINLKKQMEKMQTKNLLQ